MSAHKFNIKAEQRDDPDLRRLARALIDLAIAQSADDQEDAPSSTDEGKAA